jgi:hypothetical protein
MTGQHDVSSAGWNGVAGFATAELVFVAPDGHIASSVHLHGRKTHTIAVHLFAASVDAALRRHKPVFPSSRKVVVFVSCVNVPGITPVSLLSFRRLLSQHGKHLLHKHQRAKQVFVLNVLNFLRKTLNPKNNIGTATTCN